MRTLSLAFSVTLIEIGLITILVDELSKRYAEEQRRIMEEKEKLEGRTFTVEKLKLIIYNEDKLLNVIEEQKITFKHKENYHPVIYTDIAGKITHHINGKPRTKLKIEKNGEEIDLINEYNIENICQASANTLTCKPSKGIEVKEGETIKLITKRLYRKDELSENEKILKFKRLITHPTKLIEIEIKQPLNKKGNKIELLDYNLNHIHANKMKIEGKDSTIYLLKPRDHNRFYILNTIIVTLEEDGKMKPWEHPKVKKALQISKTIKTERIKMKTPEGEKEYTVTWLKDPQGNTLIEIRTDKEEEYILIPERTLKQILKDIDETG